LALREAGAFAAALGELDSLVFAGGISEKAPQSARGSSTCWHFLVLKSKKNAM